MGIEAILGGVAFAGLFGLWVILPSKVRQEQRREVVEFTSLCCRSQLNPASTEESKPNENAPGPTDFDQALSNEESVVCKMASALAPAPNSRRQYGGKPKQIQGVVA